MTINAGYFPQYPLHDNLPDPEIRAFVTNFYQASDRPDSDELWISYFMNDAVVTMGNDVGRGTQGMSDSIFSYSSSSSPPPAPPPIVYT